MKRQIKKIMRKLEMTRLMKKKPRNDDQLRELIKVLESKSQGLEKENRKNIIKSILMLNRIYVLEDDKGNEVKEEYLLSQDLEVLAEILELYIEELKKEVGEIDG